MSGVNQVTFTDKVNTRTLPIPAINKGRDVDFNELKAKHNDLDTAMTDPATGLVKVVDDLGTALGTAESNITGLGTSKEATANKAVDFSVVNDVKFPTTKAVDDFLVAEVPEQDPDNFATVSNITYIQNEFGRKITSTISFERSAIHAGSFDETTKRAVQPIYTNLAVTKTGAFHKNNCDVFHSSETTPTAISSPESWFIIIGDSYLTGLENLNVLEMTYYERVKVGVTYYEDVVVCNIIAISGGNRDLTSFKLIECTFNENDIPVTSSSVLNYSPAFSDFYVPEVITPLASSYELISGDNYGLIVGTNSITFPTRTEVVINVDPAYLSRISTKVTVIARIEAITFSTANNRVIISNFSTNGGGASVRRGFSIILLSDGRIRVRVARAGGTNQQDYSADALKLVTVDTGYYFIATTIEVIGTTPEIKTWWESEENLIDFENIQNTVGAHALSLESPLNFSLDKEDILTSTTCRATGKDHLVVYDTVLTESQIISEIARIKAI